MRNLRRAGGSGGGRIGERDDVLPDGLQRGPVLRRSDDRQHQRTVLIGLTELLNSDEIRTLRQLVEVVENSGMESEALSEFVSEKFIWCGNLCECRNGNQRDQNEEASNHHNVILSGAKDLKISGTSQLEI